MVCNSDRLFTVGAVVQVLEQGVADEVVGDRAGVDGLPVVDGSHLIEGYVPWFPRQGYILLTKL
jgi:hypothetical protein